ncbi:MAG: Uma2 family endonuclease [Rhizobiaceae bacterium]|nr:Uma2 family endonuclease [Rhizobiaceae bacterium]
MNVHNRSAFAGTADDFLRWNEGREGKREFVDGRVTEMMVGVSRHHITLASRLSILVGGRLPGDVYTFGSADFAVRTSRGIRYPDFFVDHAPTATNDLAVQNAVLLAEILSPSSLALDFGPKAVEYMAIPSLRHYLVLSQDEPRVWLWDRGEGGFAEPAMIDGADRTVTLSAFDLTLSLADLYRGIA